MTPWVATLSEQNAISQWFKGKGTESPLPLLDTHI